MATSDTPRGPWRKRMPLANPGTPGVVKMLLRFVWPGQLLGCPCISAIASSMSLTIEAAVAAHIFVPKPLAPDDPPALAVPLVAAPVPAPAEPALPEPGELKLPEPEGLPLVTTALPVPPPPGLPALPPALEPAAPTSEPS